MNFGQELSQGHGGGCSPFPGGSMSSIGQRSAPLEKNGLSPIKRSRFSRDWGKQRGKFHMGTQWDLVGASRK